MNRDRDGLWLRSGQRISEHIECRFCSSMRDDLEKSSSTLEAFSSARSASWHC